MGIDFPEYAVKFSKDAKASRDALSGEPRAILSKILDDLTEDPNRHPERLIPASRDGKTYVYVHPSPAIQITYEVDDENKIIYFFHFSAPSLEIKKTIFISYSHKDREWLDKLRAFLTALEQQGVITFWDDTQLEPGRPWEEQLKEVLESATAGILLISQDFLASKFITETELPALLNAAEQEGKHIFWVPLSPSTVFDTHRDITKYQSLLRDPNISLEELAGAQQKKALVEISKRLSNTITNH